MIGKITIGKSCRGCILYCLNDKIQRPNQEEIMKNRAELLLYNKCYGNQKELIQQFNEVRQLNTKLSKPVLHITLSLASGEKLANNKLMEICESCAKDFGFENNQYTAINHKDTDHQHLHIVSNRIGFDKKTVSDSNNYKKIANFCRKIELQYELQQVLNPKKFLSNEMRLNPRLDRRKELLKACIKNALTQSKNYAEFEQKMKAKGYRVIKGRGISFIDNKKVKVKGSEVNFSLLTIERMLQKKLIVELKNEKAPSLLIKKPPANHEGQVLFKNKEEHSMRGEKKELARHLNNLMKPEKIHDQLEPALLKKKKKSHGLHL
jgi:hypothetical protein